MSRHCCSTIILTFFPWSHARKTRERMADCLVSTKLKVCPCRLDAGPDKEVLLDQLDARDRFMAYARGKAALLARLALDARCDQSMV